jgi:branched-chain amino acid transport system ATP-binding protein
MMRVRDISAGYGRIEVLRGISLDVAAGSCVGILGHNGMGKTTLLKTLIGLVPCTGGSIEWEGRAIERLPTHARARMGIGYVPQGRQIFPGLSVLENLHFAARASRNPVVVTDAVLAEFPELDRLLDRPGGTLSGGEQQLLAVARALCGQPRLLLLDEPTEGVQPSIVAALVERISALRARLGLAVLLVEQNLDFIRAMADRALLIQRGRIVNEIPRDALEDPILVAEFVGVA